MSPTPKERALKIGKCASNIEDCCGCNSAVDFAADHIRQAEAAARAECAAIADQSLWGSDAAKAIRARAEGDG